MAITRDQVVDRILGRLARGGSTEHQANIVAEINIAQEFTFERGYPKPWFILDVATVQVDSSGYRAPWPTSFIELFEESPAILMVSSDGSILQPMEVAGRSTLEWSLSSPDTPSTVSVMENYFLFATKLTANTNIRVLYYKKEPLNTVAYGGGGQPAANRWLTYAADYVMGYVGNVMAGTYIRDKAALEFFNNMYLSARQRLIAENTSHKEAAKERFLNGALYPVPEVPRTITQTT